MAQLDALDRTGRTDGRRARTQVVTLNGSHEHAMCPRPASLDRWLQRDALRAHRAGISRTTVWTAPDQRAVVAYHAIAPTQVARIELPSRSLSAGHTRIPGYLTGRRALPERSRLCGLTPGAVERRSVL